MSDSGIFKVAVKLSPERRAAYLDQACGSNHALRREVESLLQAHDGPGSFLQGRLAQQSATVDGPPSTETPGSPARRRWVASGCGRRHCTNWCG